MLVTTTPSDSPGRARSTVACTRAQPTEKFTYYGKPRLAEGEKSRGWITTLGLVTMAPVCNSTGLHRAASPTLWAGSLSTACEILGNWHPCATGSA